MNKCCETGPTVYRLYPRRRESLTIYRCHYKGSAFSSVILRPWGFEAATSHTVVRYSTNWAYPGSEINFFMQAPTGNWNFFFSRHMEKCVRQKATIKFFLCSETQATILVAIFSFKNQNEENVFGAAWRFFPLTNKIKYKHADYLYTYHWKTTTNESNAGHIRSLIRATAKCFKSTLYLLLSLRFGEEMYATEKLPFGSLLLVQNALSFRVLSRRSTHRYEIVNRPLATGCEILVANAKFLVALATRKAQFRTLLPVSKYQCQWRGGGWGGVGLSSHFITGAHYASVYMTKTALRETE